MWLNYRTSVKALLEFFKFALRLKEVTLPLVEITSFGKNGNNARA